jgi:hypothetical protein
MRFIVYVGIGLTHLVAKSLGQALPQVDLGYAIHEPVYNVQTLLQLHFLHRLTLLSPRTRPSFTNFAISVSLSPRLET